MKGNILVLFFLLFSLFTLPVSCKQSSYEFDVTKSDRNDNYHETFLSMIFYNVSFNHVNLIKLEAPCCLNIVDGSANFSIEDGGTGNGQVVVVNQGSGAGYILWTFDANSKITSNLVTLSYDATMLSTHFNAPAGGYNTQSEFMTQGDVHMMTVSKPVAFAGEYTFLDSGLYAPISGIWDGTCGGSSWAPPCTTLYWTSDVVSIPDVTPTPTPTFTPTLSPTPTTGSIEVDSVPEGASVYLDGIYKGKTPDMLIDVIQGFHQIKLSLADYNDWSYATNVTAGGTSHVNTTLTPAPTPPPPTNRWLLSGILFAIILIGILVVLMRKTKGVPESEDLEITRGYEVLENKDLRFGILVTNRSNYTVNDVDVHIKYDRSLFSLKDKEVISLGNITKNNPKTATYFFTPLVGCVHNSKISAIASYRDASDNSLTVQIRPKEVHCISPFLAEKPMTEEQFSKLYESHSCHVEGIVFKGISADAISNFIVDSAKNKRYVVKNSFVNGTYIIYLSSVAKDKTFYLITVIISSEKSLTHVGLRACSNNEGGINNFINEILTALRHYVNSVQSAREVENVTNNISVQIINSEVHGGVSIGGDAFGRDESFKQGSRR